MTDEPFLKQLEYHVRAGNAGLWVVGHEAEEVARLAAGLDLGPDAPVQVFQWDAADGVRDLLDGVRDYEHPCAPLAGLKDPVAVLSAFRKRALEKAEGDVHLLLLHNFHLALDHPVAKQALINAVLEGKAHGLIYVVLSPRSELPLELSRLLTTLDFKPPERAEVEALAAAVCPEKPELLGRPEVADAALGLTRREAEQALSMAVICDSFRTEADPGARRRALLGDLWEAKDQVLRKSSALMLLHPTEGFATLGGMAGMKKFHLAMLAPDVDGAGEPGGSLVLGPAGTGKCFSPGTKVLMYDGTVKKVEDVKVGDQVMGPDSKPRNVTGTTAGHGEMFMVKPNKGYPYFVNEDHILSLRYSGRKDGPGHGEVVNISVRDYLKKAPSWRKQLKGWKTGVDWEKRPVPIDPYYLGAWLGDGTARSTAITTIEPEIKDLVGNMAEGLGLRHVVYVGSGRVESHGFAGAPRKDTAHASRGRNHTNSVYRALQDLGLLGNKHIPMCYLVNDRETRLSLLAGLIDTDGYLSGKSYEITQKSVRVASDIVFLARSLGFLATVRIDNKACVNNGKVGTYYRVFISGNVAVIPVRVPRKKAALRRQVKNHLVTGIEVIPWGEGPYYGFGVDGDHLFLLADFTVTHNSEFCRRLGFETGRAVVRLDVGSCYNKHVGESEAAIRSALDAVDAMGPVVLMIDEVEKALSGVGGDGDSGVSTRVFGTLLTWMSDRRSGAYVVATSNDVSKLPPEFSRAGRFDRIFFLDLPGEEEREAIWRIYTAKYGIPWEQYLPVKDAAWTGAEIRQACRLARKLKVSLFEASTEIVPVAETYSDAISRLRTESAGRFICARTGKKYQPEAATTAARAAPAKRRHLVGGGASPEAPAS